VLPDVTGAATTVGADLRSRAGGAAIAAGVSRPEGRAGAAGFEPVAPSFCSALAGLAGSAGRAGDVGTDLVAAVGAGGWTGVAGLAGVVGLAVAAVDVDGDPFGLFVPSAWPAPGARSDLPADDAVVTVRSSRGVSAGASAVSGLSGEVTSCP
jgi:hypothetical protein